MSQRGNDHSLLNETNESTFRYCFRCKLTVAYPEGKKVNVALHTSPKERKSNILLSIKNFYTRLLHMGRPFRNGPCLLGVKTKDFQLCQRISPLFRYLSIA